MESYDHLMGLFPAMGRPVTISFLTPTKRQYSTGGVVNFKMEDEIEKVTQPKNSDWNLAGSCEEASLLHLPRSISLFICLKFFW